MTNRQLPGRRSRGSTHERGLTIIRENKAAFWTAEKFIGLIGEAVFPAYISTHLVTPVGARATSKALDAPGDLAVVSW